MKIKREPVPAVKNLECKFKIKKWHSNKIETRKGL
jgi:hypothetical protein